MEQFQCNIDRWGNLWVAGGWVYQLASQNLEESEADPNISLAPGGAMPFRPGMAATGPTTATFIGGSGRLLIATPSMTLDNPDAEVAILGFYTPDWVDYWINVANTGTSLEVTSVTDSMIHDGTNIVAEWASGDDAPLGVYAATTYGKNTYNDGNAFNITITEEITGGRLPGTVEVEFSSGTAQAGVYSPTGQQAFSNALTDWTITIDTDGVAEIKYLTNVVATRITPASYTYGDPSGDYESTSYGETNYNGGDPFTARISQRNLFPRSGYAIVQCNMSSGDLVSVAKPFFATAIPASTSTETYVPVFKSDGSSIAQQLHTGMLIIP